MYAQYPLKFYIGGNWVAPTSDAVIPVENPATGAEIAQVALGTETDVNAAVSAALKAQKSFRQTTPADRKDLLLRILSIYETRAADVSKAIRDELGAPYDLAYGAQTGVALGHLRAFADAIDQLDFEHNLPNGSSVIKEPIGVVGLITPWNWPIHQISLKVFAALAAGCCCVLKPSEVTPLNALVLAEILDEAGVPAGGFNLVNGDGQTTGAALARHPKVAMMSFTGSTAGGMAVAQESAKSIKKVALELGGKSPCLIFADADLDAAMKSTLSKVFGNSGQNCNAPTRILVERPIYEKAKQTASEIAATFVVGDPQKRGNHIGPVANARQWHHIQSLIQSGLDQGANLLIGGPGKPDGLENGHYVQPTVFADVTADMDIVTTEIFGPVVVMSPFDTEDEAVNFANDTDYGLAAFVHSADKGRVDRLTRQLEAGMVFSNGADISYGSPFGGCKKSGYGREGGVYGIEEFQAAKLVSC
ncbi:MAG: aldehyde dehydrogenase family protein [Roseibium sp.]